MRDKLESLQNRRLGSEAGGSLACLDLGSLMQGLPAWVPVPHSSQGAGGQHRDRDKLERQTAQQGHDPFRLRSSGNARCHGEGTDACIHKDGK